MTSLFTIIHDFPFTTPYLQSSLDLGFWTLNLGFWIWNVGFGMLDFVFWPGGLVLYNCHRIYSWFPPLRLHISSHLWILDFGFRLLDFGFWPGGLVLYNCRRIYSWLPPLRLHIFKVIFSSLLFRNTVTIAILLLSEFQAGLDLKKVLSQNMVKTSLSGNKLLVRVKSK